MERIYADTSGGTIKLGRQGENEAREIIFDISSWTSLYGVGVASLVHKRHGDEYPYPCYIERNGDELVWTVKLADVANNGVGECELIYTVDNIVVKSIIWSTFVAKSLTDELEATPKPEQSWVDRVIAAASNMKDGFSPKVNVTPIEGGYRITIIDADHSETFDITNGDKGDPGNVDGITVEGVDLPVEAGKVALPIVTDTSESMATGASALGLCKIPPFSMLYASGGAIDVKEANPSVIAQRSSPSGDVVLTAPYVNDIVKAALTDENRIRGLTDAEKENARSVIGAAKASKLDILWKLNEGISYDFYTDSTEAYEKAVTSGAKYGAIEKIGGKTVSWNQLHRYSNFSDATKFACVYGTLSIANGEATYTVTTPKTNNANRIEGGGNSNLFSFLAGRFYLASIFAKADASNASANGNVSIVFYSSKAAKGSVVISESDKSLSSEYKQYSCIVRIDADGTDYNPRIGLFSTSGGAEGDKYYVKQFTVTDLTQMFGAGNEPSTVEDVDSKWAEQYAVSHPEYTAGVLMSASVNSVSYKDANAEAQIIYPIPASVLALTGYGWSVGNVCNTIERTETGWQYVQRVGLPSTENGYTVLDTPIVTDITERMTDFPEYFTVESGGTITFVNENGLPVPNTVEYLRMLAEVKG